MEVASLGDDNYFMRIKDTILTPTNVGLSIVSTQPKATQHTVKHTRAVEGMS